MFISTHGTDCIWSSCTRNSNKCYKMIQTMLMLISALFKLDFSFSQTLDGEFRGKERGGITVAKKHLWRGQSRLWPRKNLDWSDSQNNGLLFNDNIIQFGFWFLPNNITPWKKGGTQEKPEPLRQVFFTK